MGGVIIKLTKGMGEQLMYGIPARVVLQRLVGLVFDGRHSCAGDSFAGHSGLYRGKSLDGEYTCLCVRLGRRALYK